MAVSNPRSQITILDIAKLAVMLAMGFGALKLAQGHSGLFQLCAFVLGVVSLPVLLWALFTFLDKSSTGHSN